MKKDLNRFGILFFLGISLILHLLLFSLFSLTGLLDSQLKFDKEEIKLKADQAKKRKKEKKLAKNLKKPLSSNQAKKLKESIAGKKDLKLILYRKKIQAQFEKLSKIYQQHQNTYSYQDSKQLGDELKKRLQSAIFILKLESRKLARRYSLEVRVKLAQEIQNFANLRIPAFLANPEKEGEKTSSAFQVISLLAEKNANAPLNRLASPGWHSLGLSEDKQIAVLAKRVDEIIQQLRNPFKKHQDENSNIDISLSEISDSSFFGQYQYILSLENQFLEVFDEIRALEVANEKLISLSKARKKVFPVQRKERNSFNILANSAPVENLAKLKEYAEAVKSSIEEAKKIHFRLAALLNQLTQNSNPKADNVQKALARAAQTSGSIDLSQAMRFLSSEGKGEGTNAKFAKIGEGGENMQKMKKIPRIHLPSQKIQATSLVGRRYSQESERAGWVYIDAWHIIGPWENHGAVNYSVNHPPEQGVDLDAVYENGKGGKVLRWEFTQSNNIRVIPPYANDATYYLFTEIYFEEGKDMLLSISSDDAAKVWINGQVIWQENGLSSWYLGEGIRKVYFKKGINIILVRLENGPGEVLFSFLLCPPEKLK